jgi:hypothetical protein
MYFLTQDHNGYRYEVTDLGMAGGSFWQCRIRIARQLKEGGFTPFWDQSTGDMRRLHRSPGAAVAAGEQIARDLIDGKLSELHAY